MACSGNNPKGNTMSPYAIISVQEAPETFKKNNENIKQYWNFNDNPLNINKLGVTFYNLNFPSNHYATVTFTYPNVPTLIIENVSSTSGYFDHDSPYKGIQSSTVHSFLENSQGSYAVTQKDAFIAIQKLFKQFEEHGWKHDHRIGYPRLSVEDSYDYNKDEDVTNIYLNYKYPLDFKKFQALESLQSWNLRYGTDVFLDINMQYNFEEELDNYVYMISLNFMSQENYLDSYVTYNEPEDKWNSLFLKSYSWLPIGRLQKESKALELGLDIQQDQPDYTLPLVLKETGIDTSKFVSIDPYKITYEEFMKRSEAGEDMTPYYENRTKPSQPEITSQAKGRCLAGQTCPKSGYWLTFADADSRAYFKQGDVMPDYPSNDWGKVIWQFDGKDG